MARSTGFYVLSSFTLNRVLMVSQAMNLLMQ